MLEAATGALRGSDALSRDALKTSLSAGVFTVGFITLA